MVDGPRVEQVAARCRISAAMARTIITPGADGGAASPPRFLR